MTDTQLLIEVRALREALHRHALRGVPVRHGWLKPLLHDLEYNPRTQYRVHLVAAYFWVVNAVVVSAALLLFPEQWNAIAVFYVAMVSLYANFSTDYGAMSAALAAQGVGPLPELPLEPHVGAHELK